MTIRVLLVDDQELFRAGIAVILDAQPDLQVVGGASDGIDAVRQADDLHPDVVLMDVRMPELDGVDATRQLFSPARVATRPTPLRVIVLTTFSFDDRAAMAIRLGASGFLLKDAAPTQLIDAIRTVHGGNAVMAPRELAQLLDGRFGPVRSDPVEFAGLTERERDVFTEVARGLSNAEIAARQFTSESTVKTHVGAVLRKLGLRDRVQVVVYAYEHGLVPGPTQ